MKLMKTLSAAAVLFAATTVSVAADGHETAQVTIADSGPLSVVGPALIPGGLFLALIALSAGSSSSSTSN